MWGRFKRSLSGNHQNNNNNNNNSQLVTASIPVVLLPKFIFSLPVAFWKTPAKADKGKTPDNTIGSFLTPRDKKNLSLTCKEFYLLYKDEFEQQRKQINTLFKIQDKPYNSKDLHNLLSHTALGEWKQAEAIWSNDPSLLTRCGTIYHPNRIYQNRFYQKCKPPIEIPTWQNLGRYKYANCTAWQIAMMNEEYEEAELMGKMMTEEEKQRQFLEIFPKGKIKKYNNKFKITKKILDAAFVAITSDDKIDENDLEKMNEKTHEALRKLYDLLTPPPEHKKGLVFDVNIYLYALKLYDRGYFKLNEWNHHSFWRIRVEEVIASVLGTGFLRVHSPGLGNVEDKNDNIDAKLIKRDGCKLKDGSSYFAFRRSSKSIPGTHFFVGYFGQRGWGARPGFRVTSSFSKLVKQKQNQGQNYAAVFTQSSIVSNLMK